MKCLLLLLGLVGTVSARGLTTEEQQFVLNKSNEYRRLLAKGQVQSGGGKLQPAADMQELVSG